MIDAKRFRIAFALSSVLVVAVVVSVLLFGVIPTPSFPSIQKAPLPGLSGQVAYVDSAEGSSCVRVLDLPKGIDNTIGCGFRGGAALTWLTDGSLAVQNSEVSTNSSRVNVYDVPSGKLLQSFVAPAHGGYGSAGMSAQVSTEGAGLVGPNGNTIVKFRGPEDYSFANVQVSPDNKFLLIEDTDNRFLVATRDGKSFRVAYKASKESDLATLYWVSWHQPGQVANTMSLDDVKKHGIGTSNRP